MAVSKAEVFHRFGPQVAGAILGSKQWFYPSDNSSSKVITDIKNEIDLGITALTELANDLGIESLPSTDGVVPIPGPPGPVGPPGPQGPVGTTGPPGTRPPMWYDKYAEYIVQIMRSLAEAEQHTRNRKPDDVILGAGYDPPIRRRDLVTAKEFIEDAAAQGIFS